MAEPDDGNKPAESALSPTWMNDIKEAYKNSEEADDDPADDDEPNDDDPENKGKKPDGDEGKGNGDEGDGDDIDDDEGDDPDDNPDDAESKIRFTQFKGDGKPETYLKNLEEGYANSYGEINRVKGELETAQTEATTFKEQVEAIKTAVAADPEFGKKVIELLDKSSEETKKSGGAKPSTDSDNPFVKDAETKWQQENSKSASEFAERNPEVISDPVLGEKVRKLVTRFGAEIYADEKRLPLAGELMEKAFGYLGLSVKKEEKQQLADAMKKGAAPTRKQASKKKPTGSTKQFSDATLALSKKMGISKDRLEKSGAPR